MEPILAALEVESFSGKPVRVEFTKTGGVISHTIFLVNDDEKVPVLTSRINASGQPCFTELHQQDDLLFLTGADGPCHWSMSVSKGEMIFKHEAKIDKEALQLLEQRYGLNAPRRAEAKPFGEFLHFDIACRIKSPVGDLHAEYSAVDDFHCTRNIKACAAINAKNIEAGMICFGEPLEGIAFSPQPHYSMDCISDRAIGLAPVEMQVAEFPATLRWSYAVWRMV